MTCFEKQHNQFGVDGKKTLSENVADNAGLKLSFETFFNLGNRNVIVPYLNFFTQKQLFFISFAQVRVNNEPPKINSSSEVLVMVRNWRL